MLSLTTLLIKLLYWLSIRQPAKSNVATATGLGSKEKTGFLVKSGDHNALAEIIVTIMNKDYNSLKSIGIEGRKNVLKRFDVDKMCRTTFTEYKKLIELS